MGTNTGCTHELYVYEDLLYYNGVYYGDWSVFTDDIFEQKDTSLLQEYDEQKAKLSKKNDVPPNLLASELSIDDMG